MAYTSPVAPKAPTTILTTHVGSLPRPPALLPFIRGEQPPPSDFNDKLGAETTNVFRRQTDVGIDFVNDGELGRRDYVTAARNRMSGFDSEMAATGAADLEEMTDYSDKLEGRKGLLTLTKKDRSEERCVQWTDHLHYRGSQRLTS